MKNQFKPSIPFQDIQGKENDHMNDQQNNQIGVTEQDTLPVTSVSFNQSTSSTPQKKLSKMPNPLRYLCTEFLTRIQNPEPERALHNNTEMKTQQINSLGAMPLLTLTSVIGVLIIAFAYNISRFGGTIFALEFYFFLGTLLVYVPVLVRLLSGKPSRFERIYLLCLIGICFYFMEVMVSPFNFSGFDEMIHWRTVDNITASRHLFGINSMLPASPYYPGLEIVTNALSTMSGISTFHAGLVVIAAARLLMVLSLFLFYEKILSSSRMAGIATIIYVTNPHFLYFDTYFSYESLALPLATFMFYFMARNEKSNNNYYWIQITIWLILLAVTVTHHMTDYVFDGLLIIWTIISLIQTSSHRIRIRLVATALFGLTVSIIYVLAFKGNPVFSYLGSYFGSAFTEIARIVNGTSIARPLFTNNTGSSTPILDRFLMISSIAIILFSLPFGLLCLWKQHRYNALSVTLGVFSLIYPMSQMFRFTNFGLGITDRASAFLFLPIAFVLTILFTQIWPLSKLRWTGTLLITCVISTLFLGGIILASGPSWSSLPGPYEVVNDERSLEPEGIQAATWAKAYLGTNNRVATDRINQSLMNTFGDQRVIAGLSDKELISPVFYSSHFNSADVALLQSDKVRYLVIDLRLSTALPVLGYYFEENEVGSYSLTSPISRDALTKFNSVPQINRLFDSGNIVIYDTGGLTLAP